MALEESMKQKKANILTRRPLSESLRQKLFRRRVNPISISSSNLYVISVVLPIFDHKFEDSFNLLKKKEKMKNKEKGKKANRKRENENYKGEKTSRKKNEKNRQTNKK